MNTRLKTLFTAAFTVVGFCSTAPAVTCPLPADGSRLVSQNQMITIPEGDTQPLEYFVAECRIGFSSMMEASLGMDTFLPKDGIVLSIPQQLILPNTVHEGIVTNSTEIRLYYHPKGTSTTIMLPIDIDQLDEGTPIDWATKVKRKGAGPTWTPTVKMHIEYRATGGPPPTVVPAGPDNPTELYVPYIGRLYAIHGTSANFGVGLRISRGCMRLRNEDIESLFERVLVGTRVRFINGPVRVTIKPGGSRYIKVHNPSSATEVQFEGQEVVPVTLVKSIQTVVGQSDIDQIVLDEAIKNRPGVSVCLS